MTSTSSGAPPRGHSRGPELDGECGTAGPIRIPPRGGWRLGIDGSNLVGGGGAVTHLAALLSLGDPEASGIGRVVVWGGDELLRALPRAPWLELVHRRVLDGPLANRVAWQLTALDRLAARECDLLYAPGGSYPGRFQPYVTMSRNMLPFDDAALALFSFGWVRARLEILKHVQAASYRRAAGVIFLTRTAKEFVERRTGPLRGRTAVVPHGVSLRFRRPPVEQRELAAYSPERPFRWLYVSRVEPYKHQWQVVAAIGAMRAAGLPVALDLIGPDSERGGDKLARAIAEVDPGGTFVKTHGELPHAVLRDAYHSADGFVFASSCENLPNILLEAMAAGLPIACSDRSVMPEVLADAGLYFDPVRVDSIADALTRLTRDPALRAAYARRAFDRTAELTWERCASRTFEFMADVLRESPRGHAAAG